MKVKFFKLKHYLALSLSLAAFASAQSDGCLAKDIVTRCLQTETPKAEACSPTDYKCQCSAYQAIATCYNNCPNDPRASPAQNQVTVYCARVSTSSATPSGTSTSAANKAASSTAASASASATDSSDSSDSDDESSDKQAEPTSGAGEVAVNVLAVAGIVAAMI